MTYLDKHIVETYSNLLEGLSSSNKLEIIENLSKSIEKSTEVKDRNFYKSFGAFSSEKSSEKIIKEIKSSRKFKRKEMSF